MRAADGCVKQVSIGKMYAFWRAAAEMIAGLVGPSKRAAAAAESAAPLVIDADDDDPVNLQPSPSR